MNVDKGFRYRFKRMAIFVGLLALLVAACGGETDSADTDAGGQETEGAGGGQTASEEEPAGGEETADTGTDGDGEAYYDGKTIRIIVGSSPGGGTDRAARLLAQFISENVPGNPSTQVENIEAAAGATVANDWLHNMPDDGTHIMMTSTSFHIPWLLGDEIIEFDLTEMQLLWANPSGRVVMIRSDTGVEEPADLLDPPSEIVHGGRGPELADLLTLMGFEVLGVADKMTHIWGYEGGGDAALAFEQGEVNIGSRNPSSVGTEDQHLIDSGDAILLYSHGRIGDGSGEDVLDPEPIFPELPTLEQVYRDLHGEEPSGDAWEAFKLVTSVAGEAGHAAWLHPSAPAEAVEALRSAIAEFVETDEYKERHEADLGVPVSPHVGDGLGSVTNALQSVDEGVLSWLRSYLREEHGVQNIGE